MEFPLVRTVKLVGFLDHDSQGFLPIRIYIFHKLSEGFCEYFASVLRFRFRFWFGYWHVY